jgi:hypothetical protein
VVEGPRNSVATEMTSWNEDNFLERIMPYWRRGNPKRHGCPTSASLSAFVANELGASERDAMAAHLGRCSECTALHDRLVSFSQVLLTVQDLEWKNAEKRLGNWMEDFLRSQPGATLKQSEMETAADSTRSERKRKWFLSWEIQWALGAVTGLAIVMGGVLLLRFQQLSHSRESEVAVQEESPLVIESPSEKKRNESGSDETIANTRQDNPGVTNTNRRVSVLPAARTGAPVEGPTKHGVAGGQAQNESQIAQNAPPKPLPGHGAQSGQTTITHGNLLPNQPSMDRDSPIPSVSAGGPASLPTPPLIPAFPAAYAPAPARPSPTHAPATQALVGVALDRRASFQIKGETRIWIQYSSTIPQTDGTFPIQGTLQQPIMQAGAILLARGTEIRGFGTLVGGKISQVALNEFIVNGTRYTLLNQVSGTGNTQLLGTGRSVQFEGGQVLEVFYDTDSVYQRKAGVTPPHALPRETIR